MFDEYVDTERVCKDCLSDRYFLYPDGLNRCKYCGHVEGTPAERTRVQTEDTPPVERSTGGRATRKRSIV